MGSAEIRGEKSPISILFFLLPRFGEINLCIKIGGGRAVPDHLGQSNYAEMCILFTKYISKLNKIRITCHVFNYVFQILVFQLLDNCANKHAEQPRFFSCFPATHAL